MVRLLHARDERSSATAVGDDALADERGSLGGDLRTRSIR